MKNYIHKNVTGKMFAVILVLCAATKVHAAVITFAYEGIVNETVVSAGVDTAPFDAFLGETIRIVYSFDSTAMAIDPAAAIVSYPLLRGQLTLGANTYNDFSASEKVIQIVNDNGINDSYGVAVVTPTGIDVGGFSPLLFSVGLIDNTQTALSNTDLPLVQPDPLDFTRRNLQIMFLDSTGSFSATITALGNVQISAVPIPAAVWLFGSGLIGLIGLARSKSN